MWGHQRPPRRPVGQLEHGAPCRHASPRDLTAATEPEQHEQRQEDREVHRPLQPGEDGACCGNREPELPHDLVGDGVHGIDEVVVVALRDEPTIPLGDDPVQNAGPRLVVLVEHDLADRYEGFARVSTRSPRSSRGSIDVPERTAYDVGPPSWAGPSSHQPSAKNATVAARPT